MRTRIILAIVLTAVLLPAAAARSLAGFSDSDYLNGGSRDRRAYSETRTYSSQERESQNAFGWAVVTGSSTTSSDWDDFERLHDVKADLDRDAFFVRYGSEQWVITDRRTVERAADIVEPVRELGQRARAWARARRDAVQYDLREGRGDDRSVERMARVRARLEARRAELERRIRERDRAGYDTDALEEQRDAIDQAIDALRDAPQVHVFDRRQFKEDFKGEAKAYKDQHRQLIDRANRELDALARDAIRHGRAERID